jgi:tRNA U34 5-methylaminomethyl-2-thiouridine-forming methyltransferase MnmC
LTVKIIILFLNTRFIIVNRPEVITTSDGSTTLYLIELDEQYHSVNGAITESRHVFLKNGLEFSGAKPSLNLLEIGFGTGLNALLTAEYAIENKIKISYCTIEKYPLEPDVISELNFGKLLGDNATHLFDAIHSAEWGKMVEIHPYFRIFKIEADMLEFEFKFDTTFDVVYFDAFGPDKQPEMWNHSVFTSLFEILSPLGVIVTYSAKGEVRRRMTSAGFTVERLPGPPGKREMLRGIKK